MPSLKPIESKYRLKNLEYSNLKKANKEADLEVSDQDWEKATRCSIRTLEFVKYDKLEVVAVAKALGIPKNKNLEFLRKGIRQRFKNILPQLEAEVWQAHRENNDYAEHAPYPSQIYNHPEFFHPREFFKKHGEFIGLKEKEQVEAAEMAKKAHITFFLYPARENQQKSRLDYSFYGAESDPEKKQEYEADRHQNLQTASDVTAGPIFKAAKSFHESYASLLGSKFEADVVVGKSLGGGLGELFTLLENDGRKSAEDRVTLFNVDPQSPNIDQKNVLVSSGTNSDFSTLPGALLARQINKIIRQVTVDPGAAQKYRELHGVALIWEKEGYPRQQLVDQLGDTPCDGFMPNVTKILAGNGALEGMVQIRPQLTKSIENLYHFATRKLVDVPYPLSKYGFHTGRRASAYIVKFLRQALSYAE